MAEQSDWELEFPQIYKAAKDPQVFILESLLNSESFLLKLIYLAVWVLIGYLVYSYVQAGGYDLHASREIIKKAIEWNVSVYKAWRSFFMLLLAINTPLLVIIEVVLVIQKKFGLMTKFAIKWLSLIFFVTFAYAIAGLLTDLGLSITVLNWQAVTHFPSVGSPLPSPLP